MNKYLIGAIALCLLTGSSLNLPQSAAQTEKPKPKETSAQICFAKLKKLAGDWTHKEDKSGKEMVSLRYRVISGGSAVKNDMHIHHLVFTFLSDDHFTQEWSANKDGNQAGLAAKFESYRKAP